MVVLLWHHVQCQNPHCSRIDSTQLHDQVEWVNSYRCTLVGCTSKNIYVQPTVYKQNNDSYLLFACRIEGKINFNLFSFAAWEGRVIVQLGGNIY